MGKRGPKAAPVELKLVRGERKDRINDAAPTFSDELPACPPYIPAEGKKIWDQVCKELDRNNILSGPDGPSLEAYVMEVVIYRKAARDVVRRGPLVKGYRNSRVKNPSLSTMKAAAAEIRAFAREFGLTPSARSDVRVPAGGSSGQKDGRRFLS